MKSIEGVLEKSPIVEMFGEKYAFYSVHCCWWTSFPEDLGNTAKFMPGKLTIHNRDGSESETDFSHVPCCPHCGSVLLQAPLDKFVKSAQENPKHYGHFGLDAFLEAHHRNSKKCHRSWEEYNNDIWRRFHPDMPQTYA